MLISEKDINDAISEDKMNTKGESLLERLLNSLEVEIKNLHGGIGLIVQKAKPLCKDSLPCEKKQDEPDEEKPAEIISVLDNFCKLIRLATNKLEDLNERWCL